MVGRVIMELAGARRCSTGAVADRKLTHGIQAHPGRLRGCGPLQRRWWNGVIEEATDAENSVWAFQQLRSLLAFANMPDFPGQLQGGKTAVGEEHLT